MQYSNYITSRRSNLAALSAVAYGNSEYFYYVQNQFVHSRRYRDLYRSRPSQLFFDLIIDIGSFNNEINEFIHNNEIIDFNIKLAPSTYSRKSFSYVFIETLSLILDTNTRYNRSFVDLLNNTFDAVLVYKKNESIRLAEQFKAYLINKGGYFEKIEAFITIILNNPNTKIYDLPESQLIVLLDSLNKLEYNSKGLNNNMVEIPIEEWEDNYVYRGIGETRNSNVNLRDYILANSVGYTEDHLRNPSLYNGLGTSNIVERELRIENSYNIPSMFSANSFVNRLQSFSLIGKEPGITSL